MLFFKGVLVGMKNKNITAYIVLFMVVSVHGFAQNNDAILSYDEYVSIMIKQLPQIKNNIIQVKKAQVNVEKAKSVDDTTLVAQGQYTHQKQYTTGKNLFEPDYSETYYGYAGIERIIAPTGTRLSAGFEYDASSVKGNRTIPAQAMSIDEYQPSIKATITQPLLKNVFGIADRYGKNNAEYALQIQKLQQREDDDSVMNYYKKLYFTWIFYKQAIDILAESIANAKNLVVTVERKAKAGLAENDDLQRAYSSLYSYQADYQQYQITYRALLDELWLYINKEATPDSAYLQNYFNEIVIMDIQEIPFEKTRAYAIVAKSIDSMHYTIDVANNDTLPQMDVILSASRKNYSQNQSDALSKLPDTDYSIGLQFSYPLGNHTSQSQLQEYELSLKELEHNLNISKNDYYKNIRTILQSLKGYKDLIEINTKNLYALISQRQTERKKYEQARLDLKYLIETENSIFSQQLKLLQLKVSFIDYFIDYNDLIQ